MQLQKIKPLGNRVLIKREQNKVTKGGIILPQSAQEKSKTGRVIKVGPGKIDDEGLFHPTSVKEGDLVVFSAYAGTELKIEDEDYLLMSEEEILGLLI